MHLPPAVVHMLALHPPLFPSLLPHHVSSTMLPSQCFVDAELLYFSHPHTLSSSALSPFSFTHSLCLSHPHCTYNHLMLIRIISSSLYPLPAPLPKSSLNLNRRPLSLAANPSPKCRCPQQPPISLTNSSMNIRRRLRRLILGEPNDLLFLHQRPLHVRLYFVFRHYLHLAVFVVWACVSLNIFALCACAVANAVKPQQQKHIGMEGSSMAATTGTEAYQTPAAIALDESFTVPRVSGAIALAQLVDHLEFPEVFALYLPWTCSLQPEQTETAVSDGSTSISQQEVESSTAISEDHYRGSTTTIPADTTRARHAPVDSYRLPHPHEQPE